jgi:hypothetical protein
MDTPSHRSLLVITSTVINQIDPKERAQFEGYGPINFSQNMASPTASREPSDFGPTAPSIALAHKARATT